MKWITNCDKGSVEKVIADLTRGRNASRKIVEGDPEPSEWYTVKDMKSGGVIGLYDA